MRTASARKKTMRTKDFVTKECWRRKRKTAAGLLFVVLAISIFVACETLSQALNDRAKEQLLRFGANIVVQPKGEPVDLSSGSVSGTALLPEEYVGKVESIHHRKMLVAVSPKLYERFAVAGKSLLVAGITPDERKAKPWWMIGNDVLTDQFPTGKQVLLGHFAAAHLEQGVTQVRLGDEIFRVSGVLDQTGSPDDFMAFVPLGELQRLSKKDGMVNLIEVTTSCIACKTMNLHDMAKQIREALPADAEVLPVKQIADAQMGTLRKVMGFTTGIYLVVMTLCAFLLMNYVSASIDERRREIGMLMAMGMNPRTLQGVFAAKVLALSAIGGLLGYLIGSGLSMVLGPAIADTKVMPVGWLLPVGLALALGLALVSSIAPARRLARLEPVEALREI